MTDENRKIWERISAYAEEVLKDIDPQKTQVSVQLDALRPVMEEIAKEKTCPWKMFLFFIWILPAKPAWKRKQNSRWIWRKETEGSPVWRIPSNKKTASDDAGAVFLLQ